MKKWIKLVSVLMICMMLLVGCSSVRQEILLENTVNLSYAGAQKDGSHRYTSDVGELIWNTDGKITLDGQPFANMSGKSGAFVFADGRQMTAAMDADGDLKSVTVAPETEVRKSDYPAIKAALLVSRAESSIVASRTTATVVSVIIMLLLAAAAIFAIKPVLSFVQMRGWVKTDKEKQILLYSRIGGIALAILAVIVIIAAVF